MGANVAETTGAERLAAALRSELLEQLAARSLDEPEALAEALGVLPFVAHRLLRRSSWSVETALWLRDQLDLPVQVEVTAADARVRG